MEIRVATPADGGAVYEIYSHYIATSSATFEITQLSPEIMSDRIAATLPDFPYLVCLEKGEIVGYCYAHRLGEREAFQYGAELCIYLRPEGTSRGVGTRLYRCLMALLARQGICNFYASITHENQGSIRFHQKLGFKLVGQIPRAGYKFDRWLDLCWLSKTAPESKSPDRFIPFTALDITEINYIVDRINKELS